MRIENEPANIRFLQNRFEPGRVGAFRQPETDWIDIKKIDIYIAADQNLRARGFARLLLNQREQSVCRGAGNNFERAGFAQLPKGREQIAFPFVDKETSRFRKRIEIELG